MSHQLITLLADGPANTGPDFGKASPVGLLVVVLLLIGVFALVRSMNRHLKRVPENFGTADGSTGAAPAGGQSATDSGGFGVKGEPSDEPGG